VPERPAAAPSRIVLLIEAMTEEQVALLAEDLVEVVTGRARRQRSEVASQPL
jgi:hypothetical protein